MNIKKLNKLASLGLEIAPCSLRTDTFIKFADKAKPQVIVGRKATGPTGIAGLPKLKQMNRIPMAP